MKTEDVLSTEDNWVAIECERKITSIMEAVDAISDPTDERLSALSFDVRAELVSRLLSIAGRFESMAEVLSQKPYVEEITEEKKFFVPEEKVQIQSVSGELINTMFKHVPEGTPFFSSGRWYSKSAEALEA